MSDHGYVSLPMKELAALRTENARLREALKCFKHLAEGEVFDGLPDSHIFELVWAHDEEDRLIDGERNPLVTAGQLRRARAALLKGEG